MYPIVRKLNPRWPERLS